MDRPSVCGCCYVTSSPDRDRDHDHDHDPDRDHDHDHDHDPDRDPDHDHDRANSLPVRSMAAFITWSPSGVPVASRKRQRCRRAKQ